MGDSSESADAGFNLNANKKRYLSPEPSTPERPYSSRKRRRVSLATVDVSHVHKYDLPESPLTGSSQPDRFIPFRPKTAIPIDATPRTNRIAKSFGLVDSRVMNYCPAGSSSNNSADTKALNLLRRSASELTLRTSKTSKSSASSHLRHDPQGTTRQFTMALDAPHLPQSLNASPIAWSGTNHIAVACDYAVYCQNLETKAVRLLCKLDICHGLPIVVTWGHSENKDVLAIGSTRGYVQLRDLEGTNMITHGDLESSDSVISLDWHNNLLAVGYGSGLLRIYDTRTVDYICRELEQHRSKVHGVCWSPDGNFLASGDADGNVFVWDWQSVKPFEDVQVLHKLKHKAPVKALAWSPWQRGLLAAGTMWPEGTIRVYSITSTAPTTPLKTIQLNTHVSSLHWSPHCMELLSTHGATWASLSHFLDDVSPDEIVRVASRYSNSVTVHTWAEASCILNVRAHAGAVVHSVLSPDGTQLLTVSPKDGVLKMWHVWGKKEPVRSKSRNSLAAKFVIR